MEFFVLLGGFVGGWLLFAGPVYQAALELQEQTFDRDEMAKLSQSVPEPPKISAWWWLLPPVAYVLKRRQNKAYRDQMMAVATTEQMETFVGFFNKATGWLMVAAGAFFIACKETWELVEFLEWPMAVFWVASFLLVIISLYFTVNRIGRSMRLLHPELVQEHGGGRRGARERQDAARDDPAS